MGFKPIRHHRHIDYSRLNDYNPNGEHKEPESGGYLELRKGGIVECNLDFIEFGAANNSFRQYTFARECDEPFRQGWVPMESLFCSFF